MFEIALGIGVYAYLIFFLGIIHMLYKPVVIIMTLLVIGISLWYYRTTGRKVKLHNLSLPKENIHKAIFLFVFGVITAQVLINFVGALGPELSFDALWYHLTLPKVYLQNHSLWIGSSGILYYASMPKLIEMVYIGALSFGNEILAKLIHFGFGIFSVILVYTIAKRYVSPVLAILAAGIFYANPVVGWESTTAYIDLGRTFFELLAFLAFLNFWDTHKRQWLVYAALSLGFAITTKLLAVGSLAIFAGLFFYEGYARNIKWTKVLKLFFFFLCIALIVPSPWFIFSLITTGNPFYPFFSHTYPLGFPLRLFNPLFFIQSFWNIFTHADDPIVPVYIGLLPFIVLLGKRLEKKYRILFVYSLISLLVWYVTPQTGGGRFLMPYLPILSIVVVTLFTLRLPKWFLVVAAGFIGICLLVNLAYRAEANAKFLPVLVGKESKSVFLTKHLNFSFGDFYDTDGYFSTHIKKSETVLLYGFHNLYYVDFPFRDSTSVRKGDVFTYVAIQNGKVPDRFAFWNLVYVNPITKVQVYSAGGIPWVY